MPHFKGRRRTFYAASGPTQWAESIAYRPTQAPPLPASDHDVDR